MIDKEEVLSVVENYDRSDLTIATLGSHTAFHILKGAQEEGFRTAVISEPGRDVPYRRFGIVDEVLEVERFADMGRPEMQERLREMNALVVPHGSFVAYVGLDHVEDDFEVPIVGNRGSLKWEASRDKERKLLSRAEIPTPEKFDDPSGIEQDVMVKFPGARGGRGYFIAASEEEYWEKVEQMKSKGWVNDQDVEDAHIESYETGVVMCHHYFSSPLKDEVEVLGVDRRVETNIDGVVRMPASDQLEAGIDSTYIIGGNYFIAPRESLFPKIFGMGDRLAGAAQELFPPGLKGPFCIQTILNDDLEFVAFETSCRIDGGTNANAYVAPYAYLYEGEPFSMGRRISREVRNAMDSERLEDIVT